MKKHRSALFSLLCLFLLFCMLFLVACPGNVPTPDPDGTKGTTGSQGTSGTTTGGGDNPPAPADTVFGEGDALAIAGAKLEEGSVALTPRTYDKDNAETVGAKTFFRSDDRVAGKTYRADGEVKLQLASHQTYDGNGAILLIPDGLTVVGGSRVTIQNITLVGSVRVLGCAGITFSDVEIIGDETALSVDAKTTGLVISDCRVTGKTALSFGASDATILDSYFSATECGIFDFSETGTTIDNCMVEGTGTGIRSSSSDAAIRQNTVKMSEKDTGILVENAKQNVLVALNVVTGAQKSVAVTSARNVSVILNQVISVEAKENRNLYICDNNMGGRVSATRNNYFLADGNQYPADELNHTALQAENTNTNGNTLMDVDVRLKDNGGVGADEALLPHVDKELFVGMERRTTVKDVRAEEESSVHAYLTNRPKTESIVILAPGAYSIDNTVWHGEAQKNVTIYAYGAYIERSTGLGNLFSMYSAENMTFKGLSVGFRQQGLGQVYILAKDEAKKKLLVVTGAGMMNEFGNSNPKYFTTTLIGAQRAGTKYAFCDTNILAVDHITSDGMEMLEIQVSQSVFAMLNVGDVLTCRASNGGTTMMVGDACKNMQFIDCTIYGNTAGFAFMEYYARTATTYLRVADLSRTGEIISEELYNQYRALEEKYDVSLEISKDEEGRFRGSPARLGSVDATHTTCCKEGSRAISCLFEDMGDDGTNQNSLHARLHEVKDNGDGTVTLVYKGNLSEVSYNQNGSRTPNGYCAPFLAGDRVYVYTSGGQLVCDTPALSDAKQLGSLPTSYGTETKLYGVTVSATAVNREALKNYDLSDNGWQPDQKVLVDNMSMASGNFLFDNCLVRNIRSRGLLIKASGGQILNCSFENIGMGSISMSYEIKWGESGVTEDTLIDHNYFSNVGYFRRNYKTESAVNVFSPIGIDGLGTSADEDYLLYRNITITGNYIENRATEYAIYVNSAKNITIKGNYLGPFIGYGGLDDPTSIPETWETRAFAIHVVGAANVEISDNTYTWPLEEAAIEDFVKAEHFKNLFGTDVTYGGQPLFPDDP